MPRRSARFCSSTAASGKSISATRASSARPTPLAASQRQWQRCSAAQRRRRLLHCLPRWARTSSFSRAPRSQGARHGPMRPRGLGGRVVTQPPRRPRARRPAHRRTTGRRSLGLPLKRRVGLRTAHRRWSQLRGQLQRPRSALPRPLVRRRAWQWRHPQRRIPLHARVRRQQHLLLSRTHRVQRRLH